MTNVGIIGGGKGGTSILNAFKNIEKNYRIVGICDVNPEAPGVKLAKKMGIPVYSDVESMLKQPDLDMVIEATGNSKVRDAVLARKQEKTVMLDSLAANVMMELTEDYNRNLKKYLNETQTRAFKTIASFLSRTYRGGVVFFTTDLDRYNFVLKKDLDLPGIEEGKQIESGGFVSRCLELRREIAETIAQDVYGVRLRIWVAPIYSGDGSGEIIGTCGIFVPQLHPVIEAFDEVAPIVVQSHPEGAWVGLTDHEKIINRLASDKFDLKEMQIGTRLAKGDAGSRVLESRSLVEYEQSSKKYGHFRIIGIPLFDKETGELVGTFGIGMPRNLPRNLQKMAAQLSTNTQEIASMIQEVAASADEISANEEKLASNIHDIQEISKQINDALKFTKNVADQTKMLGLNAAIEAARAGEYGRGFGVVADEIRKLSEQSRETADQIGKLTLEIEKQIDIIIEASNSSVRQSQEQASATTHVTNSVTELVSMAEELNKIAESL